MSDTKSSLVKHVENIWDRVSGWLLLAPGEAVRWSSRLDRHTLAWSTLALAAILALSLNLISSVLFRNAKADLTADRLYTISEGTRNVLAKIDEPVNVRVYYSKRLGEVAPVFGKYFERVKALLEQYRDISKGKLQVTFVEPQSFSDAEDRAVAAGLKGVRLNQDGDTGYFGLVASNTTDNDATIEFFSIDRERFLEYDLTKLINGLAHPKKRVIGMIAGIGIDGGANPMQPMRQPTPPWMVMDQIREFFEIRALPADLKTIPTDIDALMLVQPTTLTKDVAYAIDQYALSGGRVLAFVDPVTETSPGGPPGSGMPPPQLSPDMETLLKSWGVAFDPNKVVGDPSIARRVQFGGRGRPTITEYLPWLHIEKAGINEKDPITASIQQLNLATAGALSKLDGGTTSVQPILTTTPTAGLIDADKVRIQPDPLAIMRGFQPGGKPLILAARVDGAAKSAFPDGRPKEEKKDEKPAAGATDGEKKADSSPAADASATAVKADDAKPVEAKAEPVKAEAGKTAPAKADGEKHVAEGRVNIIVVADSDFLNDQFWVDVRDFLGQQVAIPQAHNAAFVVNALENLAGGEALASLRGRGISERPFERVDAIRRTAEQQFRQKEEALVNKLKDLQEKLAQVETKGGEGGGPATVILSDKDRQTIETFRAEMINVRRDLRNVKADLRRDIDSLDTWLKFVNIAAIPLAIGIGGLAFGAYSRRRRSATDTDRTAAHVTRPIDPRV